MVKKSKHELLNDILDILTSTDNPLRVTEISLMVGENPRKTTTLLKALKESGNINVYRDHTDLKIKRYTTIGWNKECLHLKLP